MTNWNFVDTHHEYHWHRFPRDHPEWLSVWCEKKHGWWEVRTYPHPKDGANRIKTFKERENAAQFVAEFMDKYEHQQVINYE